MKTLRRLAVIDAVGNAGGGTRFVRSLLPAMRRQRPGLEIDFYGNPASIRRHKIDQDLDLVGVHTAPLVWAPSRPWNDLPLGPRLMRNVGSSLRLPVPSAQAMRDARCAQEFREIAASHDLVYFPWPYMTPVLDLAHMVCTIHDLNFKYWFGSRIYSAEAAAMLDRQMGLWLSHATPVTSSSFMAKEISRFYPSSKPTKVIRLAPFSSEQGSTARGERSDELNQALGEHTGPYVLCANNITVHKNLGAVVAAFSIVRERHQDLALVMVGDGTQDATGWATDSGSAHGLGESDVIGLGYVSNDLVDELISHAAVVVNASLYEAGNGPGLDAWSRGTPVVMSDIPPFREHLEALGVEAALFEPRNPTDIAAKIEDVLLRPEHWLAAAKRSREAIGRHTWDDTASGYLAVFDQVLAGG